MLSVRQAFSGFSMGLQDVQDAIKKQISSGQVGKIFRGDYDKLKDGKFKSFVSQYNLITDDEKAKAVRGFGGTRTVYRPQVDALTQGKATVAHNLIKEINKILSEGKHPYRAFCYFKDERATRTPAPPPLANATAPAPASTVKK